MTDLTPDSPETETPESTPPPTEPPRSGRKGVPNTLLIGLGGFLGVVIIVYFVMWFYAAGKIEQGIDHFLAETNARGNRITVKSVTTSGFPGKIRVDIEKVDAFFFGGDTVRIPTLTAEAKAWSWRRVNFSMPNGANFVTPNALADVIDTEQIAGDAYFGRLDGLPVIRINATNTRFTLSPPLINHITDYRSVLLAHTLRLSFEPEENGAQGDAFRFRIGGDVIGLLDEGASEISDSTHYIEKLDINAYMPVSPPSHLSRERLAQWRADGGQIQVENVELTWWPVHMIGGGTIGLDDALQPAGRLDLEITGFNTLVDMLAAAGLLTGNAQEMAHMGLSLMAKRRENSETPFINVPLEIREGVLYLGPVRLNRIEPVVWPGEARILRR